MFTKIKELQLHKKLVISIAVILFTAGTASATIFGVERLTSTNKDSSNDQVIEEHLTTYGIIECEVIEVDDPSLESGKTKVKQECIKGETKRTYAVTKNSSGGVVNKVLIAEETVQDPTDKIIARGTMEKAVVPTPTQLSTRGSCDITLTLWGNCYDIAPSDQEISALCKSKGGEVTYYAYSYEKDISDTPRDDLGKLKNPDFAGKPAGCDIDGSFLGQATFWRKYNHGIHN